MLDATCWAWSAHSGPGWSSQLQCPSCQDEWLTCRARLHGCRCFMSWAQDGSTNPYLPLSLGSCRHASYMRNSPHADCAGLFWQTLCLYTGIKKSASEALCPATVSKPMHVCKSRARRRMTFGCYQVSFSLRNVQLLPTHLLLISSITGEKHTQHTWYRIGPHSEVHSSMGVTL